MAAIGSSLADTPELDDRALQRASIVVVDWAPQAMKEAGDLVLANATVLPIEKIAQLSDLVTGAVVGGRADDDITIFKSLGVGLQDIVLAGLAW